jgi:TRAP-type mannitol/chloroaromatic compound transport system permease large subunit
MFIDWIGILMICIPLFVPIAVQLGFDKLYFCLLMAVNLQASFLTPPFGYAIFYIRPTLPEYVTLLDIYRSIIPFVILIIIGLVLCIIFPPIAIWLPSVMIK